MFYKRVSLLICGSSLGLRGKDTLFENIELAIATFDCDIPVKIDSQIYTSNKAHWCELQTELPRSLAGR
jgi:hypothetical protein